MANEPTYPEIPPAPVSAPFEFQGDSHPTDTTPKPIAIDPGQTYQFGSITTSGQDLVRTLMTPQNPEVEQLKRTVEQLTQTIQQLSTPQPQQQQQPETHLSQWVAQRFGESPSQLDSVTPMDLVHGLTAMQRDIQAMNQAVPQQVQGVLNQQSQAYQQVQSKEQALNQAVALFLQNKAQLLGQSVEQIQPQYAYAIRSLKNSGTYLISDNPQQVSQYAMDELTAFDRQLQLMTESTAANEAAATKQRDQRIRRGIMGEMAQIRANPRPPTPISQSPSVPQNPSTPGSPQWPTVRGLVDAEQVLRQLQSERVPQRNY